LVISPITVAYNPVKDKYRLCVDMRYVNAWLKYAPIRFERLTDLLAIIDSMEDAHVTLVDLMSGYHHVSMHEDSLT
jgi:hypothetical protein